MQTAAVSLVRNLPGTEVIQSIAVEQPNLPLAAQLQFISALTDRGDPAALPIVIKSTRNIYNVCQGSIFDGSWVTRRFFNRNLPAKAAAELAAPNDSRTKQSLQVKKPGC